MKGITLVDYEFAAGSYGGIRTSPGSGSESFQGPMLVDRPPSSFKVCTYLRSMSMDTLLSNLTRLTCWELSLHT